MSNIEKRKHIIYAHINKTNGKIYIGQSCNNIDVRAGSNGTKYAGCTTFYNAIQKYGWENFEHIVLFENLTQDKANIIEEELIKKYNTTDSKFGYNSKSGGQNGHISESVKNALSQKNKKEVHNNKRIIVYITPELEKSLQQEAEEKGTNVSNLVRMILTEREKTKDN